MTVKLIINSNSETDEAALGYSVRFAKRLHSDLFAFSVMPSPDTAIILTSMDGAAAMASGAWQAARDSQQQRRKQIDELFSRTLTSEGFPDSSASLMHYTGLQPQKATQESILASPLIFPRTAADPLNELNGAFRRVLLDAAMPVVLAPKTVQNISTVVIAWDGSVEAMRSVRFHLPLIKAHDRVIIAQNPDDISSPSAGPHSDPENLQKWFSAHLIPSEIVSFDGKVADGLLHIAKTSNADMIVSGAYGHSRIGEYFFGGATRNLLKVNDGPALALAH